jgi:hypothetical protein
MVLRDWLVVSGFGLFDRIEWRAWILIDIMASHLFIGLPKCHYVGVMAQVSQQIP